MDNSPKKFTFAFVIDIGNSQSFFKKNLYKVCIWLKYLYLSFPT